MTAVGMGTKTLLLLMGMGIVSLLSVADAAGNVEKSGIGITRYPGSKKALRNSEKDVLRCLVVLANGWEWDDDRVQRPEIETPGDQSGDRREERKDDEDWRRYPDTQIVPVEIEEKPLDRPVPNYIDVPWERPSKPTRPLPN